MLPTKDVAVMQVVSKRMRTHAFTLITCVDLDDSPLSHCVHCLHLVERFPLFELFVDNALHKLSQSGQPLTRFRLRVGGDKTNHFPSPVLFSHDCGQGDCFPEMEPSRLNAWISFPLAHLGLRELELSFHVRKPSDYQLPPGLFSCQSLEVLKLDSNLHLDGAEFSLISLPNLKLLHLHSFLIVEDDFITRLVSSCPSLEDLAITYCRWDHSDCLVVCSHSLKRLELIIWKCEEEKSSALVHIDTPNLQNFNYADDLAFRYSITNMNALVQAEVVLGFPLQHESSEIALQIQLSLVRMLSNVQHLSLLGTCVENMYYGGEFKDQLPVFHSLKTLELGANLCDARWDKLMLEILTCSPSLETLAFPEGLFTFVDPNSKVDDLEDQGWKTTEATPLCFQFNLRRIMIKNYAGIERELNIIKFLLRKASVLREFVVCLLSKRVGASTHDHTLLESTLKELPRASTTCSIRVQQ